MLFHSLVLTSIMLYCIPFSKHKSQKYKLIKSIVMMDMVQNRSRGFGFITFENGSGGAQKAIESQPINMFGKMVEVKLATPKGGNAGPFVPQPHHRKPVMSTSSNGEFAGLASSYGRAGWRAGYGSKAFGKAGWNVVGWVSTIGNFFF